MMRRSVPWLGPLLTSAVALLAAAPPAAAAVTPEECAACHGEVAESFAGSGHGRAFASSPKYGAASCESCHGAGDEHAESGEPADIVNPVKAKGHTADSACLSCHANQRAQAHWQGGEHQAAGVNCVDCHAVHRATPPRRAARLLEHKGLAGRTATLTTELCLSCHGGMRKHLLQRSVHPLKEGKMDCASCHDPHGTGAEKLLKADSTNDLCYSCHQEKRGPFLWEHSPVREDCQTCHTPHGSNHPQMLAARVNQLCQSCHLQGRHQTVAGLPNTIWNSNRACVNCHSQIHGSNHPSGPLFQR